jgi:hypothetical protein
MGLVFFYLVTFTSGTQIKKEEPKKPATKLEAFLATKGKLIIKEFYELGKVSGKYGSKIELTALIMYEPGQENKKVRGLKIEITEGGRYEKTDSSFLDLEEIESLSSAIVYMISLSKKWKEEKRQYTETAFSTQGDLSIGFYQQGNNQAAFSTSGRIGKTKCYFTSMNGLVSVKTLADKGLELLNKK